MPHAYLVPAAGAIGVGGERIGARDGAAITNVAQVEITDRRRRSRRG